MRRQAKLGLDFFGWRAGFVQARAGQASAGAVWKWGDEGLAVV